MVKCPLDDPNKFSMGFKMWIYRPDSGKDIPEHLWDFFAVIKWHKYVWHWAPVVTYLQLVLRDCEDGNSYISNSNAALSNSPKALPPLILTRKFNYFKFYHSLEIKSTSTATSNLQVNE